MDFVALTKQYYAKWVNLDPTWLDREGLVAVASPERDRRQPGYSKPFDLYCLLRPKITIISYSQRFRDRIDLIERCFACKSNLDETKAALYAALGIRPQHTFKYHFTTLPPDLDTTRARPLTRNDYLDFLCFHQRLYPEDNQREWLEPYFNRIADAGYVHGIYVDQQLVSATEAPDVPYMHNVIVEPGINTLPEYRQRGYATGVVGALLKRLLATDKVPIWSCDAANIASQKLAESVGYTRFADVIALTCP